MTKLFGLADIVAGLLFVATFYQMDLPRGMLAVFGIYLILKGVVFFMNFFSWVDIAAGVLLTFNLAHILPTPLILLGIAVFLGVKGLASLFTFS